MKAIYGFGLLAAALGIAACSNIPEVEAPVEPQEIILTASREGLTGASTAAPAAALPTRSLRMDDGSVWWQPEEEVSVFYGSGTDGGSKFVTRNTALDEITDLSGSLSMTGTGKEFWAAYPYSTENACDGTTITTVIPDKQTAVEDNFSDNTFPAVGKSKNLHIAFRNVCGGVKFFVSRSDITSVTFRGNDGETLCGKVKLSFDEAGIPRMAGVVNGKSEVTLKAPGGGTFKPGKYYYMTLLPTALDGGFTMTFITLQSIGHMVSDKPQTIKRSVFGVLNSIDSKIGSWTESVPAKSVTLDKTELLLTAGATGSLSATITPSNATHKEIQWTSSDATVASVSADGTVTALSSGSATITARTLDGVSSEGCHVCVLAASTTVYGTVKCDGAPVPGTLVSDGAEIVRTDDHGIYQIASAKKWEYVFVTIPSGYMVPCQGILPKLHQATSQSATAPERKDFELVKVDNDKFNLFVCGDFHLAKRIEDISQFNKLSVTLNSAISASDGPCYIMTLGDMTWDLYWYSNSYQFPQYLSTMNSRLSTPFFHTMGNHDNDMNSVGDYYKAFKYTRDIAPTFYSFNLGKIHFIVMDNIDYNNVGTGSALRSEYKKNYTAEQMTWLAKDLSFVDKSTPVFITSHAPVSHPSGTSWSNTYMNGADEAGEANMSDFLSAVSSYNVHFLSGHTHNIFNRKHSAKFSEHNSGAICGSWWWSGHLTSGIHLSQDGSPGGFGIWRFDGTSFTQTYQAGGHDIDYQFRAYDMNKVKEYITPELGGSHKDFTKYSTAMAAYPANTILVNVWDYDPTWTIKITEEGKSLSVTHVTAYDPLHIVALSAPRCKSASASSTPSFLTGSWPHFFKATASSATSTVTITVTDRNGKTYTETMTRPKAFNVADYKNN
ncbi:MAG: calcineurin-like phosphoesterase C-terminal domain-containing protein [Bacteroidales bacterium]|nr:calcineurin-like phosphoesterase C-terminal domain-containing protein [Bacteroidales bacterium]